MSTKAAVVKSDGHNKHHMSGDAAGSEQTASNTELESEIEIIPNIFDTMTTIEKRANLHCFQGQSPIYSWISYVQIVRCKGNPLFAFVQSLFNTSSLQGQMIHCSAQASVVHNFLRLREGGIYSVKKITVKPNKEEYRVIKDENFM
ncbi:hypothetical protein Tco_1537216, partial [Tanacetum coccineum]